MQSLSSTPCLPGAFIYCTMSTWDGSAGAPLFKTEEKTGKPQLVGIFNFSQENTKRGVAEDESIANVGCNISHIKKHVHTGVWNKKGQTSCSTLVYLVTCSLSQGLHKSPRYSTATCGDDMSCLIIPSLYVQILL